MPVLNYNDKELKMHNHLLSRHLNQLMYSTVAMTEDYAYFMLHNLSGQYVGYQRYNPNGHKDFRNSDSMDAKYYTYAINEGEHRAIAVWGLERYSVSKPLIVTEGVFNAARLHNYGINAIALLTNDPVRMRSWFKALPNRIIGCLDGDSAGHKLAKYCDEVIQLPEGMDASDAPYPILYKLFNKYMDY